MFIHEASFIFFIACIVIYTVLMIMSGRPSSRSRHNVINQIYRDWIRNRLNDHNLNAAIQGLRNIIMGNSIYASAFLILLGILAGFYQTGIASTQDYFFGIPGLSLWQAKISLNVLITIFCLLNFMLSIRMMNRLTLLFCAYPEKDEVKDADGITIMKEAFTSSFSG